MSTTANNARATASRLRPARQQRSRKSLERIIAALDELIEEKTFEDITVTEVCKRAKVAVGTFYDRVGNKDALLEHLRARLYVEIVEQVETLFAPERFAELSLRETLAINAKEMVALHSHRQGAMRAIIVEARRSAAFADHARTLNSVLMERVTAPWLAKRDELRPGGEALVRSAFLMAAGFLREAMIWSDLWPGDTNTETLAVELERTLVSFLLPAPSDAESTPNRPQLDTDDT